MADVKKFLDQTGTGYLWSKIKTELNKKADQTALEALQSTVQTIQENAQIMPLYSHFYTYRKVIRHLCMLLSTMIFALGM